MKHLTTIADIEQAIEDHSLCLFFIKAPDCGVCNVMLDKVGKLTGSFPSLCSLKNKAPEGLNRVGMPPYLLRTYGITFLHI
ncbi:MAG: hypothetical protein IJ845_02485 [Bacteroidaceae bacterium]|nr:hypothetical protein [Bacteroidaceae bacterium]